MQDQLESISSVVLSGTDVRVSRFFADELGGCVCGRGGRWSRIDGSKFQGKLSILIERTSFPLGTKSVQILRLRPARLRSPEVDRVPVTDRSLPR